MTTSSKIDTNTYLIDYLNSKLTDAHDNHLLDQISSSFNTINNAFDLYKDNEISIAFNGGKDNMLLLHLIILYLQSIGKSIENFTAIYFASHDDFTEINDFVYFIASEYKLKVIRIDDQSFKHGLEYIKEKFPHINAIFLGTRSSDPHSQHLTEFTPTDESWPSYMRIYPILKWSYHEVWQYLLSLQVPYCELYNHGYTSIGCKTNTIPNPSLSYKNNKDETVYHPAYKLKNADEERNGRLK